VPYSAGSGGTGLTTAVSGSQTQQLSGLATGTRASTAVLSAGGVSSGLSIAQPCDVLMLQFTTWLDHYDLELVKGRERCDITPLRATFDQLVQSFEKEAYHLDSILASFPNFLCTTEDKRMFASVVVKLGEFTTLNDNEEFKRRFHQWRMEKAPLKLFGQTFLSAESPLVTASQVALVSSGAETADEADASSLPPCEEEKIWKSSTLDKLEEHYSRSSSNCFDDLGDGTVVVSLKELLKVKKWIKIKIKTSFLQHCLTSITPGLRRFSGVQGAQTSWILFWADWEKKIHCIHPSIASHSDKLRALSSQLDAPASEKVGVYVASNDPDAYWYALRDMFYSYGNLDQERSSAMNQMRALYPTDINSPMKNEEFFDEIKKLHLRMVSMGMDQDYVSRECMNVLIARLNAMIKDKFYAELQMKQGTEESFYQKNPNLWFQRFTDWFHQYMRKKREHAALGYHEPYYMFHLLAAPAQEVPAGASTTEAAASVGSTAPLQNMPSGQPQTMAQSQQVQMSSSGNSNLIASGSKTTVNQVMHTQVAEQSSQGMDLATQIAQVLKSPEILAILAAQQGSQSSEPKKQKFNETSEENTAGPSQDQQYKRKGQQNNGKGNKGPFCIFHQDRVGHRTGQCPMNRQERIANLLRLGICINCRGRNHVAEACRNNNMCRNCAGEQVNKHMTVLCTRPRRGQQPVNLQEGSVGGQPLPPQGGQNQGDGDNPQ
jgi:hypothetical protein